MAEPTIPHSYGGGLTPRLRGFAVSHDYRTGVSTAHPDLVLIPDTGIQKIVRSSYVQEDTKVASNSGREYKSSDQFN